jgi:hypothetical protein
MMSGNELKSLVHAPGPVRASFTLDRRLPPAVDHYSPFVFLMLVGPHPHWLSLRFGPQAQFTSGYSALVSASVLRAFVTENAPRPVASDRASIRSTLLLTTPASLTCPRSTMM